MSLLDDLSNTLSPKPAARPYGLLGDFVQLPQLPAQAQAEAMPSFDFSPTDKQQKNALWSSLARMGAAMLANNRGGFANALGHGLAAQQEGYQGALDRSQNDNVQQFRTSALKDDWQAKQQERQRDSALRQALGELDWSQPGAHKSAAQLLVQAGDYDGAKNVLAMDQSVGSSKRFGSYVVDDNGQVFQLSENGPPVATGIKANPNMQYVTGPDGAPRSFNRRTGTASPVMQDGAPLPPPTPKLKDMPPAVLTGISENRAFIGSLNELIASLDPKNPNSPARKAFGGKNYIGGTKLGQDLINSQDPAGVDVRSKIANIGSKLIHDRSGAAVTASELKNLTPFLPQLTDSPDVVRKKLQNLREYVNNELKGSLETYSPANGYRGAEGYPKPVSQSVPKQVPANTSKTYTMDQVRNLALKKKASVQDVVDYLKAQGISVR